MVRINAINLFTITSGRDTRLALDAWFRSGLTSATSPRPETVHLSGESVGSTRRGETSVSGSACKRSSTLREVTHFLHDLQMVSCYQEGHLKPWLIDVVRFQWHLLD